MENNQRKPLLRPFETILLIMGIGIVGYIFLKKQGVVFMEKTEQGSIVDHPQDQSNTRTISYDKEENMTDLESILQELTSVSKGDAKLSKSDVDFYQKIKENYKKDGTHTVSWMKYLSSSYSIYSKIRSIFSNGEQTQTEMMLSDFKNLVSNPTLSSKLVSGIESIYNIPSQKTKDFIEKEQPKDAAGLVEFIEKNQ